MVALGLLGMGVSLLLAGALQSLAGFALAFMLYAPASGLACSLAQAALMDRDPEQREASMAGWALAGTLGDLVAPLAIWAAVAYAGDHRLAYFSVGALLVTLALLVRGRALTAGSPPPVAGPSESLKSAFRNRPLLLWLAGVSLCGLLDELFAAFAALHLSARFSDDPSAVTKALTACTLGSLVGLALLPLLLRRYAARALLVIGSLASVVAYLLWLTSESVVGATLAMGAVGAFVAWQYPLAQAQAYRAAAERSGLVAALSPAITSVELVLPPLFGLLADRLGLGTALFALLLQPLGLILLSATRLSRVT
jgi:FSR family fosmidomycin resistance protein-like MFS transporter